MTAAAEDRDTRAAIEAVTRCLQNRGEADDEPLAAVIVAVLRGHGWRVMDGLRPADGWRMKAEAREPGVAAKGAIEAAKALAAAHAVVVRARDRGEIPPAGQHDTGAREETRG